MAGLSVACCVLTDAGRLHGESGPACMPPDWTDLDLGECSKLLAFAGRRSAPLYSCKENICGICKLYLDMSFFDAGHVYIQDIYALAVALRRFKSFLSIDFT